MLSTTEALDYDFTVVLQLRYKKRDYSIQVTLKGKDISKANSKVRQKHPFLTVFFNHIYNSEG